MSLNAIFWIIFAIAFGIAEAMTVNFITIWFAIGAVASFIASIFTVSVMAQICIFAGVSVIALVLTRPLVKKLMKNKTVPTNADRVVSQKAVVTEEINEISGTGQVKAMGQVWSAKSEDGESIEIGEEVIIIEE